MAGFLLPRGACFGRFANAIFRDSASGQFSFYGMASGGIGRRIDFVNDYLKHGSGCGQGQAKYKPQHVG